MPWYFAMAFDHEFGAERFLVRVRHSGEITDFDEAAWIEPKERKHVSRAVPLAIAASAEALSDAALDPESMSLKDRREIGVMLGTGGGAQEFSEEQYRHYFQGSVKQASLFSIPSGTMGTLSSEVSMRFGFRGFSHVFTTGCTSSTDALGYALRQIQYGALPAILVGGVDTPLAPGIMKGFCLMKIMTPSWNEEPERGSRPFSRNRDGFVVAEGSWMFVLEEYEHARARGARIYAEIAGYGSTCEAFHRVRLAECGEEPARAIQIAMQEAGAAPEDIKPTATNIGTIRWARRHIVSSLFSPFEARFSPASCYAGRYSRQAISSSDGGHSTITCPYIQGCGVQM